MPRLKHGLEAGEVTFMARILVVDDEPSIRMLIRTILQAEGHTVTTASNGREALEMVIENVPDLIVLDLMMPEMDGWHLLEELHMRGLRRHTRVVIVSGHYDPEGASEDRRAHAHHFLPKPFDPTSLVDLVNDALDRDPTELYKGKDRTVNLQRLIERIDEVLQ
jgi:CheY-like chemotaxis protein